MTKLVIINLATVFILGGAAVWAESHAKGQLATNASTVSLSIDELQSRVNVSDLPVMEVVQPY
jgi:hypothetical protein